MTFPGLQPLELLGTGPMTSRGVTHGLARFLEGEWSRAFRVAAINGNLAQITEVRLERHLPTDQCRVLVKMRNGYNIAVEVQRDVRAAEMSADEVEYLVRREWSRAWDDAEVERVTRIHRLAYEQACRAGAPAEQRHQLHQVWQETVEAARYLLTDARPVRNMTATEVAMRQQAWAARARASVDSMAEEFVRQAMLYMLPPIQHQASEAEKRGIELLRANLTPEQLAEYDKHQYFHVIGSVTGRCYRIEHGRQMNISERREDYEVRRWCFLPEGGLVAGDCMLAQKIALENDEAAAIGVANLISGPRPSRADYRRGFRGAITAALERFPNLGRA